MWSHGQSPRCTEEQKYMVIMKMYNVDQRRKAMASSSMLLVRWHLREVGHTLTSRV